MASYEDKLRKWKLHAFRSVSIIAIVIIFLGILHLCGIIWQAVAAAIWGGLLAFLLHGLVNKLASWHIPRIVGSAIAIILTIVVIFGCMAIFLPALVEQVTSLINNMPYYIGRIEEIAVNYTNGDNALFTTEQMFTALDQVQTAITEQAGSIVGGLAGGLMGVGVGIGNFLLVFFIGLLVALWILVDLPKLGKEVKHLLNDDQRMRANVISNAFGTAIYGWTKATLLCAVINGLLCGILFWIVGIPYSALLGFLCGVLYIIPYIGSIIGYIIGGIIALFVSPMLCVISVVINVLVHEVVANLISPRMMKSSVNVHPALVLIAILAGEGLGGVLGMLAAVPLIAAAQTIFVAYFEAYTGKELYSKDGALFHKNTETVMPKHLKKAAASASDTLTNLKLPKNK